MFCLKVQLADILVLGWQWVWKFPNGSTTVLFFFFLVFPQPLLTLLLFYIEIFFARPKRIRPVASSLVSEALKPSWTSSQSIIIQLLAINVKMIKNDFGNQGWVLFTGGGGREGGEGTCVCSFIFFTRNLSSWVTWKQTFKILLTLAIKSELCIKILRV